MTTRVPVVAFLVAMTLGVVLAGSAAAQTPNVRLGHFKCYIATGQPVNQPVGTQDQFGSDEQVRVGRPLLFCNPTRKITAAGAVFGVNNAIDHLVCYQTDRRPFEKGVTTLDQFGAHEPRLKDSDLLCAPTRKLDFERIQ